MASLFRTKITDRYPYTFPILNYFSNVSESVFVAKSKAAAGSQVVTSFYKSLLFSPWILKTRPLLWNYFMHQRYLLLMQSKCNISWTHRRRIMKLLFTMWFLVAPLWHHPLRIQIAQTEISGFQSGANYFGNFHWMKIHPFYAFAAGHWCWLVIFYETYSILSKYYH